MENPGSFDINTGQEIITEDPESGKEIGSKNKKTGLIICVITVIVLAAAALLLYLFVFGNKKVIIINAVKNTFENINEGNNKLLTAINLSDMTKDREYTVSVKADTSISDLDVSVDADVMIDKDVLQIEGNADIAFVPTIEFILRFDEERVSLYIPMIKDHLFYYDYHKKNDGYVDDLGDTEVLNDSLDEGYGLLFDKTDIETDIYKDIAKVLDETEVRSVGTKKYEVDGNKVMCKGYEIVIDKENAGRIGKVLSQILDDDYKKILSSISVDTEKLEDELEEYVEKNGEMSIEVYLYKGKLAAVTTGSDDGEIALLFEGGDYRTQNIELMYDDHVLAKLTGDITDTTEECGLELLDKKIFSYEYDFEEGDLNANVLGMYDADAKVVNTGKKFTVSLDFVDIGDTYLGGEISVKKGAQLKDLEGDEYDLGNATEDDINKLIEEIREIAAGILGY
ncbi:MAG: hypothetical protein K6A38_05380 [Lachnospiraceae bacterium]|nr:hypothetical protein [Lachnospiraceae bacterium]